MNKHDKITNEFLNLIEISQIQLNTLIGEFAKFNDKILSSEITHLILNNFFILFDDFILLIDWAKTLDTITTYKIYFDDVVMLCVRDAIINENRITIERLKTYCTTYSLTLEQISILNNALLEHNVTVLYNNEIIYSKSNKTIYKKISSTKVTYIDPKYDVKKQREFDKPKPQDRILYQIFPNTSSIYYYKKYDPVFENDDIKIIFEGLTWEKNYKTFNLDFYVKSTNEDYNQIIVYLTNVSLGNIIYDKNYYVVFITLTELGPV